MSATLLTVWALAHREWVKFLRQPHRVVSALLQPVVFWFLFGSGLKGSFSAPQGDYAAFLYPGTVTMIVLFAAIFSTISIIEDRREGFLQSALVSPGRRWGLALGKIAGGGLLAAAQGMALLALGPLFGIPVEARGFLEGSGFILLTALGLTGLGFCIAWRMDSTQGFHAIMMLFLMPLWLLSGAFFPLTADSPGWIRAVMTANPLTYGLAGIRHAVGQPTGPSPALSLAVSAAFAAATALSACLLSRRPSRKDWA